MDTPAVSLDAIVRPDTRVADIVAALPLSVAVFRSLGIDICCGAYKTLGAACEEQGLTYSDVALAIAEASARASIP